MMGTSGTGFGGNYLPQKEKALMGHSGTIGRMALCASFFLLTAETSPPVSDTATSDFCMRLANDIGIVRPAAPDGRTVWSVNAWNFGQRLIFGGSVATGIGVTPVEPATMEDYRWLENMCLPEGKGAVCKDDDGAFRLPGGIYPAGQLRSKNPFPTRPKKVTSVRFLKIVATP